MRRHPSPESRHRAVLFVPSDGCSFPDLLHQPVDNFDTGQIAFVNGSIKRLSGKRLSQRVRSIGVAVEATNPVFQFTYALRRRHQRPCSSGLAAICPLNGVHGDAQSVPTWSETL